MSRFQIAADVIAVGLAITAGIISLFALWSSNEATANNARAEITEYAIQIVHLDRQGDERNTRQITLLAEQANAVIQTFEQDRLKLTSSTYRVLAEYTTLVTDNRSLARELGMKAVEVAEEEQNFIEEIRARRALADVAAKDGNVEEMRRHVTRALELAQPDPQAANAKVLRSSESFTGAFAVYSAILAFTMGGAPEGCDAAREYFATYEKTIANLAASESLDTSRRAYRLASHRNADSVCDLDPQEDLHLPKFHDTWVKFRDNN
jgi:hypothetical protein